MQSNGGVIRASSAREQPIHTLLSGPVGGTIGGAALSQVLGRPHLLCVDMGGTSFDMSLITNGNPNLSNETELEGLPLLLPIVEIHTIGAGGGSLAWLEAGALRVGPHSAGADPGPACYGRGGTQPTVTDANLFLGRIGRDSRLGGWMDLDYHAAASTIRSVASQLELSDVELAEGMLAIINAKMADAIRTITIKQGIDPREFSMVAFGGAGSMHAVWLARELGIREVIVPWSPGDLLGVGNAADRHPPRSDHQLLPPGQWPGRRQHRADLRPPAPGGDRTPRGGARRQGGHVLRAVGRHALRRSGVLRQRGCGRADRTRRDRGPLPQGA